MNNNNPGNIKLTNDIWKGQSIPGDSLTFVTFVSPSYGYRALFVLIRSLIGKGYNTISDLIAHYAPPGENNTESYISFVERETGINRNDFLFVSDLAKIYLIGYNMARFETGNVPVASDIQTGFKMAFYGLQTDIIDPKNEAVRKFFLLAFGLTAIYLFGSGH